MLVQHGNEVYNLDMVFRFYTMWGNTIHLDGEATRGTIGGLMFPSKKDAEEAMEKIIQAYANGERVVKL